ncbi:unnamed protein product, partial [Arabidopsis halleri]
MRSSSNKRLIQFVANGKLLLVSSVPRSYRQREELRKPKKKKNWIGSGYPRISGFFYGYPRSGYSESTDPDPDPDTKSTDPADTDPDPDIPKNPDIRIRYR